MSYHGDLHFGVGCNHVSRMTWRSENLSFPRRFGRFGGFGTWCQMCTLHLSLVQIMGKQLVDKRKLQPAGRAAKASAKNRAFKVRHGLQYSGKKTGDAQRGFGPRLRAAQQIPYESIVKMNQGAAKKKSVAASWRATIKCEDLVFCMLGLPDKERYDVQNWFPMPREGLQCSVSSDKCGSSIHASLSHSCGR